MRRRRGKVNIIVRGFSIEKKAGKEAIGKLLTEIGAKAKIRRVRGK